jgi:hypothetical protein
MGFRAVRFVTVVECDRNARFRDTGLSALIDKVLDINVSAPLVSVRTHPLRTWRFDARTELRFVRPSTKHMASSMLDFPEPFNPVMALKLLSLLTVGACRLRV